MEYKIVEGDCADSLSYMVNKKLREGWTLHGNMVAATPTDSSPREGAILFQVVVREREEAESNLFTRSDQIEEPELVAA